MSIAVRPAAAGLLVAATVLACSTSASPSAAPSGAPSVTPSEALASPSIPPGGIDHPTGATDVVLRFDEGGGFVPIEFNAAHLPYFTLYGDGTVVFQQTSAELEPTADGLYPGYPLRTGKLTEAQVQDLLRFAIGDGGLGVARAEYQNPLVADAPTAVFELNADGGSKKVSVVALGMGGEPGPDAAIKASLAKLGDQLKDFDQGGTLSSDPFDIFRLGWIADFPHPHNFLFDLLGCTSPNNNVGYCNEDADELMAEAAVESDSDAQIALYNQVQEMQMADVPLMPFRWGGRFTLVKPYVQDLTVTPLDPDAGAHFYPWVTIGAHDEE